MKRFPNILTLPSPYIVFFSSGTFSSFSMYGNHRKCVIKYAVSGPNCCAPLVKGGAVCGPHHGLRGVHLGGLGSCRPPRSYPVPGTIPFMLEFPFNYTGGCKDMSSILADQ
jgi:hypothetical protein